MGWLKIIPRVLNYLIMLGPLIYDAAKWGVRIVREFRKPKIIPPVKPEKLDQEPAAEPDLDPG